MVTLEQIKLLESKITRAIDVVTRLSEENLRLKKRDGELEELVEKLKNEKTRIEEGIVSALDRLNQFEDVIERSLDSVKGAKLQELPPQQPARPESRLPGEGRLLKEGTVSGESRPSGAVQKSAAPEQPAGLTGPAAAPVQPAQTGRAPAPAGPGPVRPEPAVPQAYLVDEEEAESAEEEDEDTGEAELDIF